MFFHEVPEGKPDPIFGLAGAFTADVRLYKVNLLIGIYKNDKLKSELMPSVKTAKKEIFDEDLTADYLPIDGKPEFVDSLGALAFGEPLWGKMHGRIYGAQTPGGTAALRVGAELLAQEVTKTIYIPHPTWPNHRPVFERAGLRVATYPYYDHQMHGIDHKVLLSILEQLPTKSAVLFHAACHNPTGCDPSTQEWMRIAHLMKEKNLLAFFDTAYQGFGDSIEEDSKALQIFAKEGLEFLVAYSCAKNFSLYCQRVGALFVVGENSAVKLRVASQVKRMIRALYSNPPAHGARIVNHILRGKLKKRWETDLAKMRQRLQTTRKKFVDRLFEKAPNRDFHYLLSHKGMFSFIDFDKSQMQQMIDKYAIYMLDNGRISVAGLSDINLDYVVNSLIAVIESS